ncbi:RNA-directed DNA polymerase, eukaryota [Tanacetum coccineum]
MNKNRLRARFCEELSHLGKVVMSVKFRRDRWRFCRTDICLWSLYVTYEFRSLLLTRKVSNGYGDMKLEAKIAVSMEYPLRRPFFTLNLIKAAATETKLGDESDQWFNELRAMESEVKQKDCKPADRENNRNVNRSRKRSNECRFPGYGLTLAVASSYTYDDVISSSSEVPVFVCSNDWIGDYNDKGCAVCLYIMGQNQNFGKGQLQHVLEETAHIIDTFEAKTTYDKFQAHTGVRSWLSTIKQADTSFVNDERIVWISVEGLPIRAWSSTSFKKIASCWGELVDWEDTDQVSWSCKHLCLKTRSFILELMDELVVVHVIGSSDGLSGGSSVYLGSLIELSEKRDLWEYLCILITRWDGETIIMVSLISMDGYAFTWSHKSASKMSKLDRFLFSEGLLETFPHLSAMCLDKHLSDHRPILLRETSLDYGPSPFRFFHSWFSIEGFDSFVENAWKSLRVEEGNGLIRLKKKLQLLKLAIKEEEVATSLSNRTILLNDLQEINNQCASELAQKSKVRWSIEGDENSKYFHGVINKRRSQLAIRGILVDGDWISDPAVIWDNEVSSMRYWAFIDQDVFDAVKTFFLDGLFPRGCNSSFIALIPKILDAKLVKDFRPISLIGNRQILDGPFIINDIISWCKQNRFKGMLFKVDFAKAFDSVKWEFLLEETLKSFGYGNSSSFSFYAGFVMLGPLHKRCMVLTGAIRDSSQFHNRSTWRDILNACQSFEGSSFQRSIREVFALEDSKLISVASKLGHPSLFYSFRRQPRGGVEQESFNLLSSKVQSVILPRTEDRWSWSLDGAMDQAYLPNQNKRVRLEGMEKDSNLVGACVTAIFLYSECMLAGTFQSSVLPSILKIFLEGRMFSDVVDYLAIQEFLDLLQSSSKSGVFI